MKEPQFSQVPSVDQWSSLLSSARSGNEDALAEIWSYWRTYLSQMVDRDLGDGIRSKLDASDIIQESWEEVRRDFGCFTGESEAEWKSWLTRLVRHNLIDSQRQFRQTACRDVRREMCADASKFAGQLIGRDKTASSLMQVRERDAQLELAMQQLSPRQREIVEMRHRDGLAYREIADKLGISEPAARKAWSRAVEELRVSLKKDDRRSN